MNAIEFVINMIKRKVKAATSREETPTDQCFPSPPKPETHALYTKASRKDDPVQADEFALFVQIVTDSEFLAADLVCLSQEIRKVQK